MRELMLASKTLPELACCDRTDENKVAGCQSQVWLAFNTTEAKFQAWSDAKIIRGVLAVLLEVANSHPQAITAQTYINYMQEIGLHRHLSQSRANGITAVIHRLCSVHPRP
ncbi:SufE family protein [Alteromonas sp. C1M14]|nr:SufE family protein [Alteromonas sp. C1M14]